VRRSNRSASNQGEKRCLREGKYRGRNKRTVRRWFTFLRNVFLFLFFFILKHRCSSSTHRHVTCKVPLDHQPYDIEIAFPRYNTSSLRVQWPLTDTFCLLGFDWEARAEQYVILPRCPANWNSMFMRRQIARALFDPLATALPERRPGNNQEWTHLPLFPLAFCLTEPHTPNSPFNVVVHVTDFCKPDERSTGVLALL